jgi:hypothetical protein
MPNPRRVDERQRAWLEKDLKRTMSTISPKIRPVSRFAFEPRWETLYDRYGRSQRVRVWHLFRKDNTRHPSSYEVGDPNWLGSFPTREEALEFAIGAAKGAVQIAIGKGPAQAGIKFQVRTYTTNEAPQVVLTDRGPESR